MKLIILGSSASYALPGEATAGYLIQNEEHSIAIDIGTGSLSNLFRWQDPAKLDALILSHLHVDHFADIYPLRLYLNFERPDKVLDVFAPEKAGEKLSCMLSPKGRKIFERTLIFNNITESTKNIGPFKITFKKMIHDIDSFALKVEANGKSLVYSSDTAYNENLKELAKDADLLLAEATLDKKIEGVEHMTASEAGKLADEANAKMLVLTHVWPTFKDKNTINTAAENFSGDIECATANKIFEI